MKTITLGTVDLNLKEWRELKDMMTNHPGWNHLMRWSTARHHELHEAVCAAAAVGGPMHSAFLSGQHSIFHDEIDMLRPMAYDAVEQLEKAIKEQPAE